MICLCVFVLSSTLPAGCGFTPGIPADTRTVSETTRREKTGVSTSGSASVSGSEESASAVPESVPSLVYPSSWAELTEEQYDCLAEEALAAAETEERRNAAFNNAEYALSYSDNTIAGSFLLSADPKAGIDFAAESHNGVGILVRAIRAETWPDYPDLGEERDVYYLVRFHNLVLAEDGTLSWDANVEAMEYPSYEAAWRVYVEKHADSYLVDEYETEL